MPKKADTVLSAAYCKNRLPTANRQEISDAGQPGLYFIVQPSGAKSWAVRYVLKGGPKAGKGDKYTIGNYPLISLASARTECQRILRIVGEGRDPKVERAEAVEADKADAANTVAVCLDGYYKRELKQPKFSEKTIADTKGALDREILSRFAKRPIKTLTRLDIQSVTDIIIDRGAPVMANRLFSMTAAFLSWCTKRAYIDASPLDGVELPYEEEESRERVLTDDELRLVWLAAQQYGFPFGASVQGMILTGQRRMEVGSAQWHEFHQYGNRIVWSIPATRTKNGVQQNLILPAEIADHFLGQTKVLDEDGNAGPLFTLTGKKPVAAYSNAKTKFDKLILEIKRKEAVERGEDPKDVKPMDHWTFHDLRRTVATSMAALRIPPHVIEAILNHQSGIAKKGVAGTYNRYEYLDEKFEALEKWSVALKRIVAGEQVNIIPFPIALKTA